MVPWIKRRHAPQFCDEIPNFQCCMTSFSHLVADLLNVDIFPNSGTKWPNSNAVRLVSPTLGPYAYSILETMQRFQMVEVGCIGHKFELHLCSIVEVACMDHLHSNNLVSTSVPKRGHAPQFCDEILNFQCCMTSFSHLVAENWLYGSQIWIPSLLIGLTVVLFLVGNSDSWSNICDLNNLVFTIVSWIKRRHMPTSSILSHKLQHG